MTATTRNTISEIQFPGSAIVQVPTGGMKKKLSNSVAATAANIAIQRRPNAATHKTASSNASAAASG
jgi:hypothetical protein